MSVLVGDSVMGRGCVRPRLLSLAPVLLPLTPSHLIPCPQTGHLWTSWLKRVPLGLGVAARDLAVTFFLMPPQGLAVCFCCALLRHRHHGEPPVHPWGTLGLCGAPPLPLPTWPSCRGPVCQGSLAASMSRLLTLIPPRPAWPGASWIHVHSSASLLLRTPASSVLAWGWGWGRSSS